MNQISGCCGNLDAKILSQGLAFWEAQLLGLPRFPQFFVTGSTNTAKLAMPQIWILVSAAFVTALATGVGALPFYFRRELSDAQKGAANALAAGLMIGASVMLIQEGNKIALWPTLGGMLAGIILAYGVHASLESHSPKDMLTGGQQGGIWRRAMMVFIIMTVHSGAEGISIGVAFGPGQELGLLVALAMALQNVPEGLAIALVLIPAGVSVGRSALWAIASSLPQPLLALPAYYAVLTFSQLLPWGLGLAAGAMLWMCLADLLPEAFKPGTGSDKGATRQGAACERAGTIATLGVAVMMLLDALV